MEQAQAINAIRAERQRQIAVEGWTREHDEGHEDGTLLRAAVFYYQHGARKDFPLTMDANGAPVGWPWEPQWWKPKTPERDLVRAGALCLAEKERLRNLQRRTKHVDGKLDMIVNALCNLKD